MKSIIAISLAISLIIPSNLSSSDYLAPAGMADIRFNTDKDYKDRIKYIESLLYAETDLNISERQRMAVQLLNCGVEVKPSCVVDLFADISPEQFMELIDAIRKTNIEGFIDKVLKEAMHKIKDTDNQKLILHLSMLITMCADMKKAKKIFAKDNNVKDKAFKTHVEYIYAIAEIEEIPNEKLFDELVNYGVTLALIDSTRVLTYILDPQSEPDIISDRTKIVIEKIFLPLLRAMHNLSENKIIALTKKEKELLDKIFKTYRRPSKRLSYRSYRQERDFIHTRDLLSFLRKKYEGDKEAQEIISWMARCPRHLFMPTYAQWWAYIDSGFLVGRGQTISQPQVIVDMIKELKLQRGSNVLEIGAGTGYVAALMGKIVSIPKDRRTHQRGQIYAIEFDKELAQYAEENIERIPSLDNVTMYGGRDGALGLPEQGLFDAIIYSCGVPTNTAPHIIDTLQKQLTIGGRMVLPVVAAGTPYGKLYVIEKISNYEYQWIDTDIGVRFVPLRGPHGHELSDRVDQRAMVDAIESFKQTLSSN